MTVKERPILFSAPMVRAILDGSKTQTRRAIKDQSIGERFSHMTDDGMAHLEWLGEPGCGSGVWDVPEYSANVASPYGKPGDRIWVRESFWGCDLPGYGDQPCVVYEDEWRGKEYRPAEPRPWARKFGHIPGIHMPRDSSRITLEITGVRVERLQDIGEADAVAEGIEADSTPNLWRDYMTGGNTVCPVNSYRTLWQSINGPGSWDANPWVWVVEFRMSA